MIKQGLAALVLGATSVLGFAPFGLWWLAILTLAGLFFLWLHKPERAARLGLFFGFGYFGVGVSWVYVSLHDFGAMAPPLAAAATLLLAAYLALFPALVGLLVRSGWKGLVGSFGLAGAWALAEWLRGVLFTGFPWLAIGYSQIPDSPLAAFAPVGGIDLVNFATALAAALFARTLFDLHQRRNVARAAEIAAPKPPLPIACAIAFVILGVGGQVLAGISWTRPKGSPVAVSLVQGNIAQEMKWQEDHIANTLALYRDLALAAPGKLVILPETAWPLFLSGVPSSYRERLDASFRLRGADLLAGVPEDEGGSYYNSILVFGADGGQSFRKHHLVPFGEYIPLRPLLGWFVGAVSIPLQDFGRGNPDQPPLKVAGQNLAMTICYEDVFGEELRERLGDATLIANVSNDAWFGESFAPWQHQQIAATRALETGRPLLRATQTGVTAFIDHRGRILASLPAFQRGTLTLSIDGRGGETPYAAAGNRPTLLLALLALLLAQFRRRSSAAKRRSSGRP